MKTALIFGGSRGIGNATVQTFAKNGYSVIFTYNVSQISAQELCSDLTAQGYDVHALKCDVTVKGEVDAVVDKVMHLFKHVDVVVNSAGVASQRVIQDVTDEEYNRVMSVNAYGTFAVCRKACKVMDGGVVVNVSSVWGNNGASCESVYAMSKHAVVGLTRSLALELNGKVRFNCVCPPFVYTDMTKHFSDAEVKDFCTETGTRPYTAEEVAKVIYLLSQEGNGVIKQM